MTASRLDHLAIANRYADHRDGWVTPRFDATSRWYHRLDVTSDYEVWLLTWLPGQGTDLHDHGGSRGAMRVVEGELTEYTVTGSPPRLHGTGLSAGGGRRFGPRHIHQVANNALAPAVSVHVYSPALTRMTRYRLDVSGISALAVDREGAQW